MTKAKQDGWGPSDWARFTTFAIVVFLLGDPRGLTPQIPAFSRSIVGDVAGTFVAYLAVGVLLGAAAGLVHRLCSSSVLTRRINGFEKSGLVLLVSLPAGLLSVLYVNAIDARGGSGGLDAMWVGCAGFCVVIFANAFGAPLRRLAFLTGIALMVGGAVGSIRGLALAGFPMPESAADWVAIFGILFLLLAPVLAELIPASIVGAMRDVAAAEEELAAFNAHQRLKAVAEAISDPPPANASMLAQAGLIGGRFGEGIRLGFYAEPSVREIIRHTGPGHLITVAPPRSGKLRDVLGAALLEWPGSAIIVDPKAELAAVTLKRRKQLGRTLVLNPFELLPAILGPSATFNPMRSLDPTNIGFTASCTNLAQAIVTHDAKADAFFNDSARDLVAGTIAHLMQTYPPEAQTLATVRNELTTRPRAFAQEAMHSGSDYVRQKLAAFADPAADDDRTLRSVLASMRQQTDFIGDTAISRNLQGGSVDFGTLKGTPTTVFLVLPLEFLPTCGKWFRLVVGAALNVLLRPERGVPVLMVLDEFAQMGDLAAVRNAMSTAAGHGLQLWPILQDLNQFKTNYGDGWESFLSCAEAVQFFPPRQDAFTADYVSKLCGKRGVIMPSVGASTNASGSGSTNNSGIQEKDYFSAARVRTAPDDEMFLFTTATGGRVTLAKRAPYYDPRHYPELRGLYSPNPYHEPVAALAEAERRNTTTAHERGSRPVAASASKGG